MAETSLTNGIGAELLSEEAEISFGPKAKEVYGFLAAISTSTFGVIYLLWALLPSSCLDYAGITWYPNKEWSVLIPCWTVMLFLTAYWCYLWLMLASTPDSEDSCLITDDRGFILPSEPSPSPSQLCRFFVPTAPVPNLLRHTTSPSYAKSIGVSDPEPWDIPLGVVCEVAYGRRKRRVVSLEASAQ